MAKQPIRRCLVSYDLPENAAGKASRRTFHRRVEEILKEFGGKTICQANGSVYIFQGENARVAAYVVAALAQEFGAPGFDENGGVYVAEIIDIPAAEHFEVLKRARQIAENLSQKRNTKAKRHAPHSIQALAGTTTDHADNIIQFDDFFSADTRTKKAAK